MSSSMENNVGYTEDGLVFMLVHTTFEGKPTQTIFRWDPKSARGIAGFLIDAANKAEEYKDKKDVGNSPNPN